MSEWSNPDVDGIQTSIEPFRPKRRVSGRRQRRAAAGIDVTRVIWRQEETGLLRDLIPARGQARSWHTIQRIAGSTRIQLVVELIENLLRTGLVVVTEHKPRGAEWQLHEVEFSDVSRARALAGLPDLIVRARDAQEARSYLGRTPPVCELAGTLKDVRDAIVIRRRTLLRALDDWIESGRSGTRYDFALFATGRTKGIVRSDWDWLIAHEILESASIVDHEPMVRVGGRWTLHLDGDARMDFGVPPAPGGLPPTTIAGGQSISGVRRWIVFENRTVFDRAARIGGQCAIVWTPGYSPQWWLNAMSHLVELGPAPVCLACDPDPAGIAIALRAARPWSDRGLPCSTAGMSASELQSLTNRTPLSDADYRILDSTRDLTTDGTLVGLREALPVLGKGEQEGFFDERQLRSLLIEPSL